MAQKELLVIMPTGEQKIISIDESGDFSDKEKILWDTSKQGPLPADVELGKMAVVEGRLEKLEEVTKEHADAIAKKDMSEYFDAVDLLKGAAWKQIMADKTGKPLPDELQQAIDAAYATVERFSDVKGSIKDGAIRG